MIAEVNIGDITIENGNVEIGDINIPAIKGDSGEIISIEIEQIGVNEKARVKNVGTKAKAKIKLYIPESTKITNMTVDDNYHLIISSNDESIIDAGYVRGAGIIGASIRDGVLFLLLENETESKAGNILSEKNITDIKKHCEVYSDETTIALSNIEIEEILKR